MLSKKILFLLGALLLMCNCSQEPAVIVYKGQNFYGKNLEPQSILHSSMNIKDEKRLHQKRGKIKFIERKKKKLSKAKVKSVKLDSIRIKTGDSLYQIARDNKIPVRNIIEANSLKPPYTLYPGDKIYIPNSRNTHIVRKGENLSNIASNYGVSANDIISTNNITNPNVIGTGTILVLPYAAERVATDNDPSFTKSAGSKIKNLFGKTLSKVRPEKAESNKVVGGGSLKGKRFIYPVKGKLILAFGAKKKNGAKNDGINIAVRKGTPVKSTAAGKVVYVGNALKGYGNLIIVKHKNNYLSAYAHNDEVYVTKNQSVKQAEVISTTGKTGNISDAQLYFGLRKGKKALNPIKYLE